MERSLESQYEEFRALSGSNTERLHTLGIAVSAQPPERTIQSFEEFKRLVADATQLSRNELAEQLRLCFRTHLTRTDLKHLLKLGPLGFNDSEITVAFNMLPVDDDGGILVSDLVEFLYQN